MVGRWVVLPGKVIIRRTAYGIPHILASDWFGAGEGYGFAFAQDDICTMANDYVTVDAQRSRYFGPNATYTQGGNSVTVTNLESDFYYQQINQSGMINQLANTPPPLGPVSQVKQLAAGYVDGYNRYLASVGGAKGIPDPRCRGAGWVHPITITDFYRRLNQLVELASGDVVIPGIADAAPPVGSTPTSLPLPTLHTHRVGRLSASQVAGLLAKRIKHGVLGGIGSNAIAVGRAGTRDHVHGMLLGNPHFPWTGPERFYQAQITIPGQVNVTGATLYGVPLILIGHTMTMAWSHTVSTAYRFTPFQLSLAPGHPTEYMYNGQAVPMTSRTVTVAVKQANGSIQPETRTLYSTRFGPVFNSLEGVPLPWTTAEAFALGDANAGNSRILNTFYGFDRAGSVTQMLAILKRYEGIPWVNTIVADRYGNVLYADIGAIPNVPNSLAAACDTALGAATFAKLRLPILDGSRSACNWQTNPDSVVPGIFGPSHLPYLVRSDFVTNSNDSFWLSNPYQPLTGFATIIGSEDTARSLRTRLGLIMTMQRIAGTDGQGPPGFTLQNMEHLMYSNVQYAGILWRDALVKLCRSLPGGLAPTSSGVPVAVGDACAVLANWDLHENLDSAGAILFRRFVDHAMADAVSPFSVPFNVNNPVNTPSGLNTSDPEIAMDLGDAISDLEKAHIPLNASPGQVQYVAVNQQLPFDNAGLFSGGATVAGASAAGGPHISIPGGPGDPNGEFDAIYSPFIPGKGYGPVVDGSSFIQAVTWNNGPCPVGATMLTYSESDSTASPFHSDQTRLFAQGKWVPDTFCPAAVLANTKSTTILPNDSPPGVSRCPPWSGRVRGQSLGPIRLGMIRAKVRHAGRLQRRRSTAVMDYLCLRPTGIRVGYPSPRLLARLATRARGRIRGHAVLILTADRHAAIRGIHPGTRFTAADRRRLAHGTLLRIGSNQWYLARSGVVTAVLQIRRGAVAEVGIADRALTRTRAQRGSFMRSF